MDEQKRTYYIDVGSGEISRSATASTWSFKIEATDVEIGQLRALMEQNYSTEWKNFFRAHVPYVQYHYDRQNDEYDSTIQQIYGMLYQLGDEEAKNHIESMNILPQEQ
ncbi:hydrolase [Neobacillus mesonae]|uniref:hydrolase n=1 Tax=Neobacillus mesonae TaxID=1193713 RepID=UPI002572866D|nr:hydrolase [Neobacillus mesonae]MED4202990.1 hydrolase [Neobacillus mesonae]